MHVAYSFYFATQHSTVVCWCGIGLLCREEDTVVNRIPYYWKLKYSQTMKANFSSLLSGSVYCVYSKKTLVFCSQSWLCQWKPKKVAWTKKYTIPACEWPPRPAHKLGCGLGDRGYKRICRSSGFRFKLFKYIYSPSSFTGIGIGKHYNKTKWL